MTNSFSSTENGSAILKDDYDATNSMKEALRRRKERLIAEGSIPANPNYSSKPIEDDENG